MDTKRAGGKVVEEPITIRQLVGLAEAAQMLNTMLIDALLTLDQSQVVSVSPTWREQYTRMPSIKIGRGCDCSAAAVTRSIKIGKAC